MSGLIEQSGPSRSQRPPISPIAARARAARASAVIDAMPGFAGRPPTTARPVKRELVEVHAAPADVQEVERRALDRRQDPQVVRPLQAPTLLDADEVARGHGQHALALRHRRGHPPREIGGAVFSSSFSLEFMGILAVCTGPS